MGWFFVDKMADPQYNPRTMADLETGRSIYQRAIEAVDGLGPTSSPIDGVRVIVELAHVEATRLLADSQRLLAETQVEANRLRRIELGMAEPGDLSPDKIFRGVAPATPAEQERARERSEHDYPL